MYPKSTYWPENILSLISVNIGKLVLGLECPEAIISIFIIKATNCLSSDIKIVWLCQCYRRMQSIMTTKKLIYFPSPLYSLIRVPQYRIKVL